MQHKRVCGVLVMIIWAVGASGPAKAQSGRGSKGLSVIPKSSSRYAILVGVDEYEKCNDLRYCSADVKALRDSLINIGFEQRNIVVLADGEDIRPSRRNILEHLDATLKMAEESDLIVLALSGHGTKIGGKSYFCPLDARPHDAEETMILIEELYQKLKKCPARLKIVFVDACRSKFLPVGSKPLVEQDKAIDEFAKSLSDRALPNGLALFASCTSGERSWEDEQLGHGVFMHFLVEGLKGKANQVGKDGRRDEWISLFELFDYVRSETKRHVFHTRRAVQRPYHHTSLDLSDFPLGKDKRWKVHVKANAMWNRKVYISWQNIKHIHEPDSANMVIDTWKVDDDGNGDPRNDVNRIIQNHPEDCANGIQAQIRHSPGRNGRIGGQTSGTTAVTETHDDGSASLTLSTAEPEGSIEARYTIKPGDPNVYGSLVVRPRTECHISWVVQQKCGVWAYQEPDKLKKYGEVVVNGESHPTPADVNAGTHHWHHAENPPCYVALTSREEGWATGMVLLDASISVTFYGSLMWYQHDYARNLGVETPEDEKTLVPGQKYEINAIFHADQDLSLDQFDALIAP